MNARQRRLLFRGTPTDRAFISVVGFARGRWHNSWNMRRQVLIRWSAVISLITIAGLCSLVDTRTQAQPAGRARNREPAPARLVVSPSFPVQTGRFTEGGGLQEIKFAHDVRGRYFSLDSLSAHYGQPYAAIAELSVLDEAGRPLNREGWTIAYADSEEREREDGAAENAIDGRTNSYWHTQWGAAAPPHPHRLIVDLGRARSVSGFRCLPPQGDANVTGRIKDFSVGIGDFLKEEKPSAELLPEKCFLFSYFTDDDSDGLHLAWSMDGYRWDDVNHGRSLFKAGVTGTNLMRDPFLLRTADGDFHLVWTSGWTGNSIGYAYSKDLIHWSGQKTLPVMASQAGTLNCWAPELFWDAPRREFLIFWASAVKNRFRETLDSVNEPGNQRLFCTTTKDFQTFSATRLFYDPGFSLIDATMVVADGHYHLIFKDETARPARKNLRLASGDNPQGPFGEAGAAFSPQGVEGATVFAVGGKFAAYYRFSGSGRWGVLKSADLNHWENVSEQLVLPGGGRGFHQGTVLEVPRALIARLGREGLLELGPTPVAAELEIGNWIWTTNVADKQTCRLWHTFDVPADTLVAKATLRLTADNGYRVFLDGREIGRGGDFNSLTEFDLTRLLPPGLHVLAVEAFNDALSAGVVLGMQIQLSNGRELELLSDPSWSVVPRDEKDWESRKQPAATWSAAQVVAFTGRQVWQHPERIIPSPPLLPVATHFWQQGWFLLLLLLICAVVAAFSVRQGLQLTVQTRSHRLLERERARIARDIHDDLGAGLTQLTLQGELIRRETPRGASTLGQVDALCERARTLLGSLDEVVWAVNPRRDTVQDFATFVCENAQSFLGATPIRCRLAVPDDLPATPLDLPARRNLLLAVKEAVRNAARHSGADEISLAVRVTDHQLTVVVEDNGRGYLPEKTPATRNGLRNMQERLTDVGGVCHLAATPGNGCRVTFTLPLQAPALEGGRLSRMVQKMFRRGKPAAPAA